MLTETEWSGLVSRPVPAAGGPYVLGIDAGGGRFWTGAAVYWPFTGRVDVRALAPRLPALAEQAERD